MFKGCYRLLWGSPYCLLLNIDCRKELLIARSWFWWIVEMRTCYCAVYSILTVLSECFAALRAFSCSWWHFFTTCAHNLDDDTAVVCMGSRPVGISAGTSRFFYGMYVATIIIIFSIFLCKNISKKRQFIPFSLLLTVFSSLVLITRLWTWSFLGIIRNDVRESVMRIEAGVRWIGIHLLSCQ